MPRFVWWPLFVGRVLRNLGEAAGIPPGTGAHPPLSGFPRGIPVFRAGVENFDGRFRTPAVWHAIPWDLRDVEAIVNWAAGATDRVELRPLGNNHSWSPSLPGPGAPRTIVMIDMRRFAAKGYDRAAGTATFGAGVTVEEASRYLRDRDASLFTSTAVGEVTLGGVLSMGGHGTGVDVRCLGGGTLNALVVSLKAIVHVGGTYREATFHRHANPDFSALVLTRGATLLTEITFEVRGKDDLLEADSASFRMGSYLATDRPRTNLAGELREEPKRIELMWMPHQGWHRPVGRMQLVRRRWQPLRTPRGAPETEPYRDPIVNWAAHDTDVAFRKALRESGPGKASSPSMGFRFQAMLSASTLTPPHATDMHAGQLYTSHFILRYHAAGWCLIVDRRRVGDVLLRIADELRRLQVRFGCPLDGPVEARITDVDPDDATPVALSPARAPPDVHPSRVFALWLNILTDLEPDGAGELLHAFESWLLRRVDAHAAGVYSVRPEWSKGNAYDAAGTPWSDPNTIAAFRAVFDAYPNHPRHAVVARLAALDPGALFVSELARRM